MRGGGLCVNRRGGGWWLYYVPFSYATVVIGECYSTVSVVVVQLQLQIQIQASHVS